MLVVAVIVFLVFMYASISSENILVAVIGIFFSLVLVYLGDGETYCIRATSECLQKKAIYIAQEQEEARLEETKCTVPQLVTEAGGVKLYKIRDCENSRWVYFSSTGTHTTHTEHHGKSSMEVDDDVPADGGSAVKK